MYALRPRRSTLYPSGLVFSLFVLCIGPARADVQCGKRLVTLPGIMEYEGPSALNRLYAEFTRPPNPFTEFISEEAQIEKKRKKENNPFNKLLKPTPGRTATIEKSSIIGIDATEPPDYVLIYAPYKGSQMRGTTVLLPRTVVTWPKFREDLVDCLD